MSMTMKKKEVLEINSILNKLKELGSTKFKYKVLLNVNILRPYVVELELLDSKTKSILAPFEKDRNDLIVRIGKKGEGTVVYIDPSDEEVRDLFNQEMQTIREKHRDSISQYQEEFAKLSEISEQDLEEELVFKVISIDDFPADGVSTEQLETLIRYNIVA